MSKLISLIIVGLITIGLNSCSKKSHPSKTAVITVITDKPVEDIGKSDSIAKPKSDSVAKKETVIKAKPKAEFPKVITVNDEAAHKSVDGRYYYDVMGHRYWRNNKDGKYYLFDKSMYNNDDFNPQ